MLPCLHFRVLLCLELFVEGEGLFPARGVLAGLLRKSVEVFLSMTPDLGAGPRTNMILNFLPVLAEEGQTLDKLEVLLVGPSALKLDHVEDGVDAMLGLVFHLSFGFINTLFVYFDIKIGNE